MPSYIAGLFNTDPYYDDFNQDKKFLRIMFRPGYGVQARELTQIQTLLQSQIERFGSHVFEEGSIVTGGKITVNSLKYARVTGLSGTTELDDFIEVVAKSNGIDNTGRASGKIVYAEQGLTNSNVDNLSVLYFDYLEGGTGFTFGDVIGGTAFDGSAVSATITGSWNGSGPYPVGDALLVTVDSGVRFTEGYFVYHEPQKLGAYTLTGSAGSQIRIFEKPTTRMGFSVDKSFVDAEQDTTLNDPAFGYYNYNAPGADRFLIDLNFKQYGFTASNTSAVDNFSRTDFIEFLRLVNGSPIKIEKYPDYAVLEDSLARRTYDESGNYTVRAFDINLVDGPGLTSDQQDAVLFADLEPGKAYIFGYEFETQGVTRLGLTAPRTSDCIRTMNEVTFTRSLGPYAKVQFSNITDSLTGFNGLDEQQTVYLSRGASGSALNQIGTARVRGINQSGTDTYNLGLFNIRMEGTASFQDTTRIFISATGPTHAFSVTGGSLLSGERYGDLLYLIPSGTRCKTVSDCSYAISALFEKNLLSVPASGITTFTIATTDYASSSANVNFSLGEEIVNFPTDNDITVFDNTGVIGGTAARVAGNDDTLSITVNGRGVTTGNKLYIVTSMDVESINYSDGTLRRKSLTPLNITSAAGGFTGVFGGLTTDSSGNRYLYFGGKVDIYEVISLTGYKGGETAQIKNEFVFDNGQRDNLYDWSRMELNAGVTSITGPFEATVRIFNRAGAVGPFTVDSYTYAGGLSYSGVPDYTSRTTGKLYNLADVIDFRPDRGPSGNIIGSPWIPVITSANDNKFSYEHYLARTDKIVLNRDRTFSVIEGIPSLDGVMPPDDPNSMTLYSVSFNPYTYDRKDASVRYVDNRRYTMRDIGELEKRIQAVEYYTTLSLLEQEAKSISVVDDTGLEMPKKGILVDQFRGHNIGDVNNSMYAASVDFEKNELRPPFETRIYGLTGPSTTPSGMTTSSDGIVTLTYTVAKEIVQPLATSTVTINPSSVFNYLGTLSLSPAGDYWWDSGLTPSVRVNVDGENDAWEVGKFDSQWNDWESIWYGIEPQNETNVKLNTTTKNSIAATSLGVNLGNTLKSGVPEAVNRKVNSKVVRKDVVPYIRENDITLRAKGLKPNTAFQVFLDDVNITGFCTGNSMLTNSKGECVTTYKMTDANHTLKFLTGRKAFRITDSSQNIASEATMAADAYYNALGYVDILSEDGVLSTRPPTVRRRSVKNNKVQSSLTELLSTDFFGFIEPLSQTFYVDPVKYPDGIFIKSVGVAFSAKSSDTNIPVTLFVKPTVSGYPHPSKIIPFGEATIYSSDITTSLDGSTETDFTFSSPINLLPGYEYAISLVTNSSEFRVYKANVGENIINLVDGVPDRKATKQPGMRSLFMPQNTGSLRNSDVESLRISIGVCNFSPEAGETYYKVKPENYTGDTYFDLGRINVSHVLPSRTKIDFYDTGLISSSSEKSIQVNKNFDRVVGRTRNLTTFGDGLATNPTLRMRFYGTKNTSPVVDIQPSNYMIVKNKINNNNQLSGTNDNRELFPTNYGATAPSEARYITKQVLLEPGFEATTATVQMLLSNPSGTSIQVFIRPLPVGEVDFTNIGYSQMTRIDSGPSETENPDTFREVTYRVTMDELSKPEFRAFAIKIVMYSNNITTDPRALPRVKNVRIIAT